MPPNPDIVFDPSRYPETPGCYLIKTNGKVIYAGKATNLRRWLSTYFNLKANPTTPKSHFDDKVARMVARMDDIEVILLHSEVESLILVNKLIQRYHPLFNLATMRDDIGYAWIVQTNEPFPRFLPDIKGRTSKALKHLHGEENIQRFGPFLSGAVRELLLQCINENFGIRTCDPLPQKTCFFYHLKVCSAPCEGKISVEEYAARVAQAAEQLSAPHLKLTGYLEGKMQAAAEAMEYERARRIRDQIQGIKSAFERQVVERDIHHDQDVVYVHEGKALVMHLKQGAIQELELSDAPSGEDAPAASAYLRQRYLHNCPPELITTSLPAAGSLASELTSSNGYPVTISLPTQGLDYDLLDIARMNHAYRVNLSAVRR
ncbi:MAG: UvrB/UvrC motif-containing protein [Omnitrophica WOR_2 bacterium]